MLQKLLHYGSQDEVDHHEGADYDHYYKEERRAHVGRGVLVVVHDDRPSFQRHHLENRDARTEHIVEVGDVVLNHFHVLDVINVNGV